MIVCVCNKVSDTEIKAAIEECRPKTLEDLQDEISVADCCGSCQEFVEQMIADQKKPKEVTPAMKDALLAEVKTFVKEQRISCPETIYQTDRVIENAYEFIEKLCDIVGYDVDADD